MRPLSSAGIVILFLNMLIVSVHAQTPSALRSGITFRKVAAVESDCARLTKGLSDSTLFYARGNGDVFEVNVKSGSKSLIAGNADHHLLLVTAGSGGGGMTVAPNGTMYLCGYPSNAPSGYNVAIIMRGTRVGTVRVWDTVAVTEPYLKSNTGHDHLFNALELSPDGTTLFVNSGSRTDHGDTARIVRGGREYPITSAVFALPATGKNIRLYNNEDSLKLYLFADGLRNTYDMAFSAAGELFGVDNSDVADDHEELNWIRSGRHYGFPWRLGIYDNPQQYPSYDPNTFRLLVTGINRDASNYNDPTFPARPAGVGFTDPVLNIGPDADSFRDTADGLIKDGSVSGRAVGSFTPHGSPLGITFDRDSVVGEGMTGGMFVMTYNDSSAKKFAPFKVPGEDLLYVQLIPVPAEGRYNAAITRIARNFQYPVDAVLMGRRMYVIENGVNSSLWEVTFPGRSVSSVHSTAVPVRTELSQNYPNPFNPVTVVSYQLSAVGMTSLTVYDMLGREVVMLVNAMQQPGPYSVRFDASGLASGIYFYQLRTGTFTDIKKFMLLK